MTQPSLSTAFDTSLIAVNRSFSSTETNTSVASSLGKENQTPSRTSTLGNMDTNDLYEQWASTYDSDGNALLAVDDLQMKDAIPAFVDDVEKQGSNDSERMLLVMDFGCGTGRNTLKLLQAQWSRPVDIVGWDASQAMLNMAREKCAQIKVPDKAKGRLPGISFGVVDFTDQNQFPKTQLGRVHGLISTLVMEHMELDAYFNAIKILLRPGGFAFISNMHPIMGKSTQAGFTNAEGERLKGVSYIHKINDTLEAIRRAGLKISGEVKEATFREDIFEGRRADGSQMAAREGGKKWVGKKIWFGLSVTRPSS